MIISPYLTKLNLTSTPLLMTKAAVWTKAQSLVLLETVLKINLIMGDILGLSSMLENQTVSVFSQLSRR